jgi:CheY-like chemotaxis protein
MSRHSILLTEDHEDTRYFLRLVLESEGFIVITAEHGAKAIELLTEIRPHLVITDLMMPQVSGGELIRHIRNTPELANLPVIVLSAFGKNYEAEACDAGATLVLQKPLDGDHLIEVVKKVLADSGVG